MDIIEAFPYGARVAVVWAGPGGDDLLRFVTRAMAADDSVLLLEPPDGVALPSRMSCVHIVREDGDCVVLCAAVFLGEDEEGWACFKAGLIQHHPKRRYARVAASIPVSVPGVRMAQTVDISGSGFLAETWGRFGGKVGDVVQGVLWLPGGRVDVTMRVMRETPSLAGSLVAFDFEKVKDADRDRIIEWVSVLHCGQAAEASHGGGSGSGR